MQQCIYATDMARHMNDLNELKAMLAECEDASSMLTSEADDNTKETRKRKMLELTVHASDISWLSRPMETQKTWAYLLFEEFFHQGDVERDAGMKLSMLCDRSSTSVGKSQRGFINFGPLPLFKVISLVQPSKAYIALEIEKSADSWDEYSEAEIQEHK